MGCIIVKSNSLTELNPETAALTLIGSASVGGTITRNSPEPELRTLASKFLFLTR